MRDDCEHGHLRRQCEICDRDAEIESLRAELAGVERERDEAIDGHAESHGALSAQLETAKMDIEDLAQLRHDAERERDELRAKLAEAKEKERDFELCDVGEYKTIRRLRSRLKKAERKAARAESLEHQLAATREALEEAGDSELRTLRRAYRDGFADAAVIFAFELPSPDQLDEEEADVFDARCDEYRAARTDVAGED